MSTVRPFAACLISLLSLALSARAEDAGAPSSLSLDREAQQWLESTLPGWLEIYRDLHSHPELSFQEKRTAGVVERELKRSGYQVTAGIGGFGVVAVLQNGAGPTLLVRGDMDALPVAEQTGLAYASKQQAKDETGQVVPVMHACGHDVHVTSLLATAAFLAKARARWQGTLLLIAQPAEEQGEGARRMIAAGLFERFPRPNQALALHVDPDVVSGHVAIGAGWVAANADSVDVTLYGRGGHGSQPQDTVDPIVMSAHFITALQTLVSRRNDPLDPAVITVGSIHGGTKRSVIPDSVQLLMTVRSYSDQVRTHLLDGIRKLAVDLSSAFGAPKAPDIQIKESYTPAVYNDPALAQKASAVLAETLGKQAVAQARPAMTAEDFGRFGKHLNVPSLLIRLGATTEAQHRAALPPGAAPVPSLHSSRFAPDAPLALRTAVRTMAALTASLLPRSSAATAPSK
jgi:amidohydrolase